MQQGPLQEQHRWLLDPATNIVTAAGAETEKILITFGFPVDM
jgi:hypothetical protein